MGGKQIQFFDERMLTVRIREKKAFAGVIPMGDKVVYWTKDWIGKIIDVPK